jgi:hypothetical protein
MHATNSHKNDAGDGNDAACWLGIRKGPLLEPSAEPASRGYFACCWYWMKPSRETLLKHSSVMMAGDAPLLKAGLAFTQEECRHKARESQSWLGSRWCQLADSQTIADGEARDTFCAASTAHCDHKPSVVLIAGHQYMCGTTTSYSQDRGRATPRMKSINKDWTFEMEH